MALSWDPIKKGAIYCSSACGADCTFFAYKLAVKKSGILARRLGKNWKPHVWENLGWHYSAISGTSSVREYASNRYSADVHVGRQYMADGRTPREAFEKAVLLCDEDLASIKKDRDLVSIAQGKTNNAKERSADIAMIKTLAEDLSYEKGNYGATLESIVVRARRLFDEDAEKTGRGYKGPAKTCRACDGVYVKEAS